jgi:SAM-dependent methyltransferase
MTMHGWHTTPEQWSRWIDDDATVLHPVWVSCDAFDEELRTLLEAIPFLAHSEETQVTHGGTELADLGAIPAFDSMTTAVRPAPGGGSLAWEDLRAEDEATRVEAAPKRGPERDLELEVGVASGELEIELDPPSDDAVDADDGRASVEAVDGLYIPALTRRPEDTPSAAKIAAASADSGSGANGDAHQGPSDLFPDLAPRPLPGVPEHYPHYPTPRPYRTHPVDAGVPELVEVRTGETVISRVPGAADQTIPIVTETEAAVEDPALDAEIPAPQPVGGRVLQTERAPKAEAPEPADLTDSAEASGEFRSDDPASSQSGEIICDGDLIIGESPVAHHVDTEPSPRGVKIVVDSRLQAEPAAVIEDDDTVALDATDLVEDAEAVEEPAQGEDRLPLPARSAGNGSPRVSASATESEAPPVPPPAPAPRREVKAAPAVAVREAIEPSTTERPGTSGGWVDGVFAEHFFALARRNHEQIAAAEAEFFVQATGAPPGSRLLDVGCGSGEHAIVLAQRGYAVTGFDASLAQLLRASQAGERLGVAASFVHGDMRDPPVEGPFEGILCLGTTLGYFDEDENRRCVRKMRELLAPGGRLMLQVFNRDYVIGRLPARSWWQGCGCLVLDETQMNYFANRLLVHRTVVFEDGRQYTHDIAVRAYTAHDLGKLCTDVGFRVIEISGSRHTRGRFYGATSPEIWLVVERT